MRAGCLTPLSLFCSFFYWSCRPLRSFAWNARPISHGLGPTYGEPWPAGPLTGRRWQLGRRAPGSDALRRHTDAAGQFQAEAAAAGSPPRMTYEVLGQSAEGRDIYGVVINALETPDQVRDYDRWKTHPLDRADGSRRRPGAPRLVRQRRQDVRLPVPHPRQRVRGRRRQHADIRDLTVTPRGANPTVDKILDNEIVVVLMDNNPDGRVNGTRGNPTGFDPNRDFFVQSQPEQKIAVASCTAGCNGLHRGARLLHADAHRRRHHPAQPGHRGRHLPALERAADRAEQDRLRRHRGDGLTRSSRPSATGTRPAARAPGLHRRRATRRHRGWATR